MCEWKFPITKDEPEKYGSESSLLQNVLEPAILLVRTGRYPFGKTVTSVGQWFYIEESFFWKIDSQVSGDQYFISLHGFVFFDSHV